ncbi:MAG TPA: hypothetical protein VMD59_17315, partial [Acidimicrobiales bacterium]|nr:hypothetical protein [Acidimicrobiales bacterium]
MRLRRVSASMVVVAAALALPGVARGSTPPLPEVASPRQFGYTGSQQTYVVPSGVMAEGVYVQGAWGGQDGGVNM